VNAPVLYTAAGNRKAPGAALALCHVVGRELAARGLTLRTSDELGVDCAFADGHHETWLNGKNVRLAFVTKAGTNPHAAHDLAGERPTRLALDLAAQVLGGATWLKIRESSRWVHGLAVERLLGRDLLTPSRFLLCWSQTVDPAAQHGTRVLARVARERNIPVLNLKGLELSDALAFAHEHAGIPVLRPGDVLPSRLVPVGAAGIAGPHVFVRLPNAAGSAEWHMCRARGFYVPDFRGVPSQVMTLIGLGLSKETATADDLARLAREHEERTRG
jgi:hypothetical protein